MPTGSAKPRCSSSGVIGRLPARWTWLISIASLPQAMVSGSGDDGARRTGTGDHPSRQDAQPFAERLAPAAGSGVERAKSAFDDRGGLGKGEPALVAGQFAGVGDAGVGLGHGRQHAPGDARDHAGDHLGRKRRQPLVQLGCGGGRPDRQRPHGVDRPGVQAFFHAEDADARLGVPGQDRALDGGCAAPARKERRMEVDASQPRRVEHRARQQQAVSPDHREVGAQGGEFLPGPRHPSACVACAPPIPAARLPRARGCGGAAGRGRQGAAAGCRRRRSRGRRRSAPRGWAGRSRSCPGPRGAARQARSRRVLISLRRIMLRFSAVR